MSKKSILMSLMLLAGPAMAKTQTLTQEQFIADIKADMQGYDLSNGELSIGGDCTFEMREVKTKQGTTRLHVVISQNGKDLIYATLEQDEAVDMKVSSDEDGSYQKTYRFHYNNEKVSRTHVDDSYDEITVETGLSKLTCGAYY